MSKIDRLARVAAGTDAADLPGLVEAMELAGEIAGELAQGGMDAGARLAESVKAEVEGIVLRTTDAPEEALARAHRAIDELERIAAGGEGAGEAAGAAPVDQSLLSAWIAGCDEMLGELEALLLAVERNAGDAEALAGIRRIMHTLKGECGVLGLHEMQRLCHEAETLVDRPGGAPTASGVQALLEAADWIKAFLGTLAADPSSAARGHEEPLRKLIEAQADDAGAGAEPAAAGGDDPLEYTVPAGAEESLADFVCEAREHIAAAEEALLALEQDKGNAELVNTVFRAFHTIKGVAGFLHLNPVVALSHRAEQLLDAVRSGRIALERRELDLALASCDTLLKLLAMARGEGRPSGEDFAALLSALDAAGSPGASADDGAGAAPERACEKRSEPVLSGPVAEAAQANAASAAPPATSARSAARRADQTVKVSTQRMDNLVNTVGELVIAQQMVAQRAAERAGPEVMRGMAHINKIVRELHEVAMTLRMVSLKGTFQRMTRLVRDVALKAGKEIVCVTEGEDVELDRNVVEEITDPLVHMIRNACDHGLEATAERIAAGKPAQGRITLRARHSGGSIVLEISDDGRGLRRDKILARARANGLLPAGVDEASIPDADVFSMIFLPGFSTAERVTDISGRGVGMDVVRRNIEALRGKIEIESEPGKGTTFRLHLPLTLAIIDGMVVRVGRERYVLPSLGLEHAFRAREEDVCTVVSRGELVRSRGRLLPLHRLGRLLGIEEGAREVKDGLLLVVESAATRCAVLVDEIIGQQQVVIKSLGSAGSRARGVTGGAILGDGRVALILDIGSLVEQWTRGASSAREMECAARAA